MSRTTETLMAAVVSFTAAFGLGYIHNQAQPSIPFCLYEDGNPDGKPCIWSDPDTGVMTRVESENYR